MEELRFKCNVCGHTICIIYPSNPFRVKCPLCRSEFEVKLLINSLNKSRISFKEFTRWLIKCKSYSAETARNYSSQVKRFVNLGIHPKAAIILDYWWEYLRVKKFEKPRENA